MDFILDYINEAVCNCNQELKRIKSTITYYIQMKKGERFNEY